MGQSWFRGGEAPNAANAATTQTKGGAVSLSVVVAQSLTPVLRGASSFLFSCSQ